MRIPSSQGPSEPHIWDTGAWSGEEGAPDGLGRAGFVGLDMIHEQNKPV